MEALQTQMEILFAKNHLIHRLRKEFSVLENQMEKNGINHAFGVDLLVQMYLHKRTTVGVLVGILWKHFKEEENPLQACADALYEAVQKDLVDYSTVDGRFIVKYLVSDDVQEELDQFQYPLPMVTKPREVKENTDTGYHTIRGSMLLKNNHHNDDIILENINKQNSVKLKINERTVRLVQNQWKNLDKPKEGESFEDFNKRKKAFDKFDRSSKDVIDSLFTATEGELYLTHKYDKRGRMYAQGYHVNYQGHDWNKAVIEFAEPEKLED